MYTIGDTFTPEQKLKMAEMVCKNKIEQNNANYRCCCTRIDGNNRVLDQMAINNVQATCCCHSVAAAEGCCCRNH